jgi:hypothetical protein
MTQRRACRDRNACILQMYHVIGENRPGSKAYYNTSTKPLL